MKPKTQIINEYLATTERFEARVFDKDVSITDLEDDENNYITIPESKLSELIEVLKTLIDLVKEGK